jgi:hypothetical protein
MSAFKIIYQITIPERMIGETFIEFMRDEYFPALHKGPTRVGKVTHLSLLRVSEGQLSNTFFMHVDYDGLASGAPVVDNEEVQRKFDSLYGAHVKRLGAHTEVAAWSEESGT